MLSSGSLSSVLAPRGRLDLEAPTAADITARLRDELPIVLQQIRGILDRAEPCSYGESDALKVHVRFLCKYRYTSLQSNPTDFIFLHTLFPLLQFLRT
jgi:hypothetical protein